MQYRIVDFTELKAYVDIFNDRGHPGVKEAVNPFQWWNWKWPGKIADSFHAYFDDGLVVVLDVEGRNVTNMLVFALCPQKNILRRILDTIKFYDIIIFNAEFGDKYKNITRRYDGSSCFSNGRHYYFANGRRAWELSTQIQSQ